MSLAKNVMFVVLDVVIVFYLYLGDRNVQFKMFVCTFPCVSFLHFYFSLSGQLAVKWPYEVHPRHQASSSP